LNKEDKFEFGLGDFQFEVAFQLEMPSRIGALEKYQKW
jgi:hypothetical protein